MLLLGSGQGTLARLLRRDPCVINTGKAKAGSAGKVYSASDIYSFVQSVTVQAGYPSNCCIYLRVLT
jgi:hypothetical protein